MCFRTGERSPAKAHIHSSRDKHTSEAVRTCVRGKKAALGDKGQCQECKRLIATAEVALPVRPSSQLPCAWKNDLRTF